MKEAAIRWSVSDPQSETYNFVTSHDGFTLQDLVSYNENAMKLTVETTGRCVAVFRIVTKQRREDDR
jgi:hypothetical protein